MTNEHDVTFELRYRIGPFNEWSKPMRYTVSRMLILDAMRDERAFRPVPITGLLSMLTAYDRAMRDAVARRLSKIIEPLLLAVTRQTADAIVPDAGSDIDA